MEPMKQQRVKFTDVANMNATRTTPPYHLVQAEKEQKSTTNPSKLTACEITCIAYMAAGIFLSLRLDVVERWWQLLVVCFFVMVGCFFGIMASAERYAEETEGGEER